MDEVWTHWMKRHALDFFDSTAGNRVEVKCYRNLMLWKMRVNVCSRNGRWLCSPGSGGRCMRCVSHHQPGAGKSKTVIHAAHTQDFGRRRPMESNESSSPAASRQSGSSTGTMKILLCEITVFMIVQLAGIIIFGFYFHMKLDKVRSGSVMMLIRVIPVYVAETQCLATARYSFFQIFINRTFKP